MSDGWEEAERDWERTVEETADHIEAKAVYELAVRRMRERMFALRAADAEVERARRACTEAREALQRAIAFTEDVSKLVALTGEAKAQWLC